MKREPIQWPAPAPGEKLYWRSLEQLADTPEFRDFVQREFPAGASELNAPLSRRSFMTLMGASLGLAGMTGCRRPEEKILPYAKAPEDMVIGLPTYFATAMPMGSSAMGLLVESNEGRPTKIEGNPSHPVSLGATNSFAQAAILDMFDPDRSSSPLLGGKDSEQLAALVTGGGGEHGGPGGSEHGGGHGEPALPRFRKFNSEDALGFLRPRQQRLAAARGKGLHVLSGVLTSPTLLRLREEMREAMPEAQWHTWEPVCEDNIRAGSRLAFGDDLTTHLDLERADIVLALDADPLGLASESVRMARQFARRRRVEKAGDGMNRLYVVESAWTITGTNADHRLRLRPSEVAGFAVALAAELAKHGATLPAGLAEALPKGWTPDAGAAKVLAALAGDLVKHRGRVAIAVGPSQPKEVHALVHALHAALDVVGTTVSYTRPGDAGRPLDQDALRALANALDRREVDTLVVLGGNPLYDAPADLKLKDRLQQASKTALVHLGMYQDETAMAAALHVPRTHFLESWGDVRSSDGTASIVQPLIAPLYKGWSDIELVSFLLKGKKANGYELVRDTWRVVADTSPAPAPVAIPAPGSPVPPGAQSAVPAPTPAQAEGGGPVAAQGAPPQPEQSPEKAKEKKMVLFFEHFWRKALHDGVIADSAYDKVKPALKAAELVAAMPALGGNKAKAMELQFLVDPSVYDGRYANNGWLQELPDPITKMVWDNAAIMSMDTAKSLGVGRDDMVRISVRGDSVEAAVFVQPGQASGTVSLALGYGRSVTGRVGKGAGFNAYQIRHLNGLGFDEATVAKLDSKYKDARDENFLDLIKITGLVTTQDHFAMEGRPLVREASLTRFRKEPGFAKHAVHHPPLVALWDDWKDTGKLVGQQWGMTIDLSACVGCGACTVACQAENNIPIVGKAQVRKGREMHWIRVDRYFSFGKETFEHEGELNDGNTQVVHQPVPCMQCEAAPCENVCPVAATLHSSDGLNDMVYNRCVGTRYCLNNCPYKVRRFNFLDWRGDVEEVAKLKYNPDVTLRSRGVMEKCTYCVQRIRGAQRALSRQEKAAEVVVADGTVRTACQQVCPAEAIAFGDITDAKSEVSRMKQSPRNYNMLEELNTKPRTSFLARIRNPHPDLEPAETAAPAHGAAAKHEAGASHL